VVQAGGALPLSVAKGFVRDFVGRQQSAARFTGERIEGLRREADALAADVACKRTAPLVRSVSAMCSKHVLLQVVFVFRKCRSTHDLLDSSRLLQQKTGQLIVVHACSWLGAKCASITSHVRSGPGVTAAAHAVGERRRGPRRPRGGLLFLRARRRRGRLRARPRHRRLRLRRLRGRRGEAARAALRRRR
jgi:hypothetical protein